MRPMIRLAALALVALLGHPFLAGPPAAAQSGSNRLHGEKRAYFRDWLAACRPDGYCSTLSYVNPDDWRADHWLRVGSAATGLDYEIIYVGVARAPSDQAALEFWVDGERIARLEPMADLGWVREPGDAVNEFRVSQSVANLTLLPAMRRGARIRVRAVEPGAAEPETYAEFSLMGLGKALRWLDRNRME